MEKWKKSWSENGQDNDYGKVLYRRATGELPEMESSKAAARQLEGILKEGDHLVDVGCAAGHYLRSLRSRFGSVFKYTGIDITPSYLELAREAFVDDAEAEFREGDIYDLPFADESFDIAMANNVLIHLPSVAVPLREIVRISKRHSLIRMMVGHRTFIIKDVDAVDDGSEFTETGEPKGFQYFNIYSHAYVNAVLSDLPGVREVRVVPDDDFDPDAIQASVDIHGSGKSVTKSLQGIQVRDSIICPWAFVHVIKE